MICMDDLSTTNEELNMTDKNTLTLTFLQKDGVILANAIANALEQQRNKLINSYTPSAKQRYDQLNRLFEAVIQLDL